MRRGIVAVFAAIFATIRLAEIINEENISLPLREHFGLMYSDDGELLSYPDSFIGELLSCFRCTSVWAAGFVVFLWKFNTKIFEVFTYWLSLSWLAIKLKN